jgi:hypothetical protein
MCRQIIGEHEGGFWCNRSITDWIICILQILEKKWEYKNKEQQLLIDSEKAYDSVRREVLYNILIEYGKPNKQFGLIKMCLNEIIVN